MTSLEFFQFPYMDDNYGVLVHAPSSGETACIDAGDATAATNALKTKAWTLSHLLITHHHADHTAGLSELKAATNCKVIGPAPQSAPITGLDSRVNEGDSIAFGGIEIEVLHTPGHTTDMINFYLPSEKTLFAGDTLFTLGCGKLFEGTPAMMWESLQKLMRLPADTVVYCSHEYTQENAAFAIQVDPDNQALKDRIAKVDALRADGKATVPSTIAEELATNPFFRASDPDIRRTLDMNEASDLDVFTEIRKRRG